MKASSDPMWSSGPGEALKMCPHLGKGTGYWEGCDLRGSNSQRSAVCAQGPAFLAGGGIGS